ncbi:MAG: aldehyde dehydrogenase family protein [Aliiglaciecola sp.]
MTTLVPLRVSNPSNGNILETITCDTAENIEFKVQRTTKKKKTLPPAKRIAVLSNLLMKMQSNRAQMANLIALEGGKPLKDAIVEAERAAFSVQLAIAFLLTNCSQTHPINTATSSQHHSISSEHFPIGPVIAVSAFNHPLNLVTHQVISAFAAGCPCIIKPAADTPLSCIQLVKLFHEAGASPEWVDYVITNDNSLAEKLVTDPRFAFFSFIGSAKVGWYLRSKLPPGTRCALEHGGVAPAFVDDSANIDTSVETLVKGAFYHAGQVCVSTQRIYIHQSRFEEFSEKFADIAETLIVGDATSLDVDVGPLIRPGEVDRVENWVEEAVSSGASILAGGKRMGDRYFLPTVLVNAPPEAKVNSQEVFGPVCSLLSYEHLEEPIAHINQENFAFHSAIFSNNHKNIETLYHQLNTGCLMVNEHTAFRHDAMTFSGLGGSGLGKGGIPASIEHMQVEKLKIIAGQQ